jgi:hypothetical protein
MRLIVEFFEKQNMIVMHSNISLSSLVEKVEAFPGVILVSQPSIYDLEIYVDRSHFAGMGSTIRTQLDLLAKDYKLNVEYVNS